MARFGLLAVAGALGVLSRYGLAQAVGPRSFPWTTLGINVVGSFLLGVVLAGPLVAAWPGDVTTAISVGFLGAFTTYSTFAFETTSLLRDGRAGTAFAYVAASLGAGLAASALGYVVGRALS
jgi:CrcB protein